MMSSERFEVGEIAIYVGTHRPWYGLQVTIVSDLELVEARDIATGLDVTEELHEIDVPVPHEFHITYAAPHELRKLPPPGDDCYEPGQWDQCPWQPEHIRHLNEILYG
jgi:hypothetical protein